MFFHADTSYEARNYSKGKKWQKEVIFNTYNEYKVFEGRKYTGMKVERIY
jgi:hypothetical protein